MKKAVLVGINDYPGKENDLMGCVNDVQNMQDLLVSTFGFSPENITMITDRDATTANILEALDLLVKSGNPGDQLIFHYSGHGSQVPDTSGDERDRYDEIICPVDIDWRSKLIRDDDLGKIFGSIQPGVHLEVFLDSCHSGTALKPLEGRGRRYMKQRYLSPPRDLLPKGGRTDRVRGKTMRPAKVQVLWAACRANQYAADALLDGRYGGAFTTFFCSSIRQAKGVINRCDALKSLRDGLRQNGFDQVPQLETASKYKKARFLAL